MVWKGPHVTFLEPRNITRDLDLENQELMDLVSSKLEEYNEYNKPIETKDD